MLLTDGKSGDAVEEKAQGLQDRGVTIFAIGEIFYCFVEIVWFKCSLCRKINAIQLFFLS